jgi:hypothetical protein
MLKPRESPWSPEDQATYVQWRRGVTIFYGCIGLGAIAAMVALGLADKATPDKATVRIDENDRARLTTCRGEPGVPLSIPCPRVPRSKL